MSWLIDTNVVSHLVRRHADPRALRWLQRHSGHESGVYLSAVTIAEMRRGALILPADDPRRERIPVVAGS